MRVSSPLGRDFHSRENLLAYIQKSNEDCDRETQWASQMTAFIEGIGKLINALVPFGIAGLAIAAILFLIYTYNNKGNVGQWLLVTAMFLVVLIFGYDKYLQPRVEVPAPKPELPRSSAAGTGAVTADDVYWFSSGSKADWGGHDLAHTDGEFPNYRSAAGKVLCDQNHVGNIATCWDNRADGRVPGLDSNVPSSSSRWCTYKDNSIRITTPPTGYATPGVIYVCAPRIPRGA
jgi:hypothetical protein